MTTNVYITVENVNDLIDQGYTRIELESSSSPSTGFAQITTLTLVADDFYYSYEHAAGTDATWYRYRFTGVGGAAPLSPYSNPFQPRGLSREVIRQKTIVAYNCGVVFTSLGGDANTVTTLDIDVLNPNLVNGVGKNGWLKPSGLTEVVIVDSNPSAGSFDFSPAYALPIPSGTLVEWHWTARARAWDDAINRAMRRYWWLERVPITGPFDSNTYEFPLTDVAWLRNKSQLTGLWYYPLNQIESVNQRNQDTWLGHGRWWDVPEDAGSLTLHVWPAPRVDQVLYLEAMRRGTPLATDAAVAPAAMQEDLVCALVYDEMLAFLSRPGLGWSEDKRVWTIERRRHRTETLRPMLDEYRPRPRYSLPTTKTPQTTYSWYKAR